MDVNVYVKMPRVTCIWPATVYQTLTFLPPRLLVTSTFCFLFFVFFCKTEQAVSTGSFLFPRLEGMWHRVWEQKISAVEGHRGKRGCRFGTSDVSPRGSLSGRQSWHVQSMAPQQLVSGTLLRTHYSSETIFVRVEALVKQKLLGVIHRMIGIGWLCNLLSEPEHP